MIMWAVSLGMAAGGTAQETVKQTIPEALPQPMRGMVPDNPRRVIRTPSRANPPEPLMKVEPAINPLNWLSYGDYPEQAAEEKRSGTSTARLTVDENGGVVSCAITASSGHADLDDAACLRLSERARFYPATDRAAQPIASTYSHTVVWKLRDDDGDQNSRAVVTETAVSRPPIFNQISDSFPQAPRANMSRLTRPGLNDYPAGALARRYQGTIRFSLSVDPQGKITNCQIVEPADDAEINAATCAIATRLNDISPALDVDGNPTRGRMIGDIEWRLPAEETVVYPAFAITPRPIRLPFIGSGMTGFDLETKADGSVVSCVTTQEGELPKELDFVGKMCADAKKRGVQVFTGLDRDAEPEAVGIKMRFEMRFDTNKVENDTTPKAPAE